MAPSASSAAGQYGAIAWDRESCRQCASWNQDSPSYAEEVALSDCGAVGCKLIIRADRPMRAALATNDSGNYAGGAARRGREAARLATLANCEKGNAGNCINRITDCNH